MSPPGTVAVIGLGYVGLPLAVAFARHLPTIGFDVNRVRAEELTRGLDRNGEVTEHDLRQPMLSFTSDPNELRRADVLIVAVPTPVDRMKSPDLSYLESASRIAGAAIAARAKERPEAQPAILVYESTVFPGCTEEVCAPIVEAASGLSSGRDFKLGYSPERINPGDAEHTLERVVKVVAAQDAPTQATLTALYGLVVKAGIHEAPDIRTAEAAKVIENTQRDLNIALMSELSMLFHKLGIDTQAVLAAARTKWNFLPFQPGLVGGHCIPEDPYYLTYKAALVGHHPDVILAGRRINDGMGIYTAHEALRLLIATGAPARGARVLVLGVTFKEDVKDTRNSRVVDIVRELERFGMAVGARDEVAGVEGVRALGLQDAPTEGPPVDVLVLAVPHRAYKAEGLRLLALVREGGVVVDVKGALDRRAVEASGRSYWRL